MGESFGGHGLERGVEESAPSFIHSQLARSLSASEAGSPSFRLHPSVYARRGPGHDHPRVRPYNFVLLAPFPARSFLSTAQLDSQFRVSPSVRPWGESSLKTIEI